MSTPKTPSLVIDPVCGMQGDPSLWKHHTTFHFCCEGCQKAFSEPKTAKPQSAKTFLPLWLLFLYITLSALAVQGPALIQGAFDPHAFMHAFMAGFFLAFSFFKALDWPGFVQSFKTYDLLAKRIPAYAWAVPLLECLLGLSYLFGPGTFTHSVTLVMMSTGALSALQVMRRKQKIVCACLGTVFHLPMTKVTLFENLLMGAMALLSLLF